MPDALMEGLGRQLENLAAREAAGETLAGWKVGLTSGRARNSMGDGFRPFGYILASRVFESPASVRLDGMGPAGLENEMCFTIGAPLTGEVTRAAIIDAVAGVAPAFEINEQRLSGDVSPGDRIADDLSQWGIVVGENITPDWTAFDFTAVTVALSTDGSVVEEVAARDHIDDHFDSLAALVKQLGRFDRGLRAGDRVITGSYTRARIEGPSKWTGDFGAGVGTVTLEFV
ncbi:MAG: hypothetical protein O7H39_07665 [Gammaproteobacteria bacterium]|nr:hypothetical protein [Gammaproteobacteria bacterium]